MTKFFEETWFWWWLLAVVAIVRSYSPVVVTYDGAGEVSRAKPHSATTEDEPSAL